MQKMFILTATIGQQNLIAAMSYLQGVAMGVQARPAVTDAERSEAIKRALVGAFESSAAMPVFKHATRGWLPETIKPKAAASQTSLEKKIIKSLTGRVYAASTGSIQKHIAKDGKHKAQSVSPRLQAMVKAGTLITTGNGRRLKYKLADIHPRQG